MRTRRLNIQAAAGHNCKLQAGVQQGGVGLSDEDRRKISV